MRLRTAVCLFLAVILGACTSDQPSSQTAPTTTQLDTAGPGAGPGALTVTLMEARMACGPSDGPAITFTADANQFLSAVAVLVVGDRTVATTEPFELGGGRSPWTELLPVVLDPNEFELGHGELLVQAAGGDGEVLTSRTISLRLAGLGCG